MQTRPTPSHTRKCVFLVTGLMLWGGYSDRKCYAKKTIYVNALQTINGSFHLNQESRCDRHRMIDPQWVDYFPDHQGDSTKVFVNYLLVLSDRSTHLLQLQGCGKAVKERRQKFSLFPGYVLLQAAPRDRK